MFYSEDTMVVPKMDTLPRVPDTHGDTVNEKIFSDLYIRTSWVDANVALDQIKKVMHFENTPTLIFFVVLTTHIVLSNNINYIS